MRNRKSLLGDYGNRDYTISDYNILDNITTDTENIDYSYDLTGNMTGKDTVNSDYEYIYDEENRLIKVKDDGNVIAKY